MSSMILFSLFFAASLISEVSPDPSSVEVEEVIYEEDISDTPDQDEDLDTDNDEDETP